MISCPECDSIQIASCNDDNSIRILSIDEKCLKILMGHKGYVNNIIELKNGQLVSCSDDNTIKIWNLNDNCLKMLIGEGYEDYVNNIVELNDG